MNPKCKNRTLCVKLNVCGSNVLASFEAKDKKFFVNPISTEGFTQAGTQDICRRLDCAMCICQNQFR